MFWYSILSEGHIVSCEREKEIWNVPLEILDENQVREGFIIHSIISNQKLHRLD